MKLKKLVNDDANGDELVDMTEVDEEDDEEQQEENGGQQY